MLYREKTYAGSCAKMPNGKRVKLRRNLPGLHGTDLTILIKDKRILFRGQVRSMAQSDFSVGFRQTIGTPTYKIVESWLAYVVVRQLFREQPS